MRTYQLQGEVRGIIWMPACEATKEFSRTFTKVPSEQNIRKQSEIDCLRDALLQIVNDGDFQECGIDWAILTVTDRSRSTTRSRSIELVGNDGNSDCFWKES